MWSNKMLATALRRIGGQKQTCQHGVGQTERAPKSAGHYRAGKSTSCCKSGLRITEDLECQVSAHLSCIDLQLPTSLPTQQRSYCMRSLWRQTIVRETTRLVQQGRLCISFVMFTDATREVFGSDHASSGPESARLSRWSRRSYRHDVRCKGSM